MKITLLQDDILRGYDSGGGCRDRSAEITIDVKLHPRMKRKVAIYETLGLLLGHAINHEQLEDISDHLLDVFDQLEPI